MNKIIALALLTSLLAISACTTTTQVKHPANHGFLGKHAKLLHKGGPDQPALYYLRPGVDWAGYRDLLIDPVTIWTSPATKDLDQGNAQQVANRFLTLLRADLSKDFHETSHPGTGTLRLQVALTELDSSDIGLNLISTAVPQARVLSKAAGLATGEPVFTGRAGMAFRVKDAATGEILAAGIDDRAGTHHLSGVFKKWSNVDDALNYWAAMLRYDFCRVQARPDCTPPKDLRTL